jgi:RHS repeat-associated protein
MQATYVYDPVGQRIEKDVWDPTNGLVVRRFGYDQGNPWVVLDGNNVLQTRRFFLDGVNQLFARLDSSGNAAWYLPDRMGSIRDLTDATGTVQEHLNYDGFGNVTSDSNPSFGDRYRWTGQESDAETGLQHNGMRFYDPKTGRFISQDPIGFHGQDPNLYRYVGNNSTNLTDPTGLLQDQPRKEVPEPGYLSNYNQGGGDPTWEEYAASKNPRDPFSVDPPFMLWAQQLDRVPFAQVHHVHRGIWYRFQLAQTLVEGAALSVIGRNVALREALLEEQTPTGWPALGRFRGMGSFERLMEADEAAIYAKYWSRYAPDVDAPGSRLDFWRMSSRTGRLEFSQVIYDEAGRQRWRIDWTDHMRPADHSIPHLHEYTYGIGTESGAETIYRIDWDWWFKQPGPE